MMPAVQASQDLTLIEAHGGNLYVHSNIIASLFVRPHKNVMRDIDTLIENGTLPRHTITKHPVLAVVPIDQVTAIARHQHIHNAISTASWHLRHGRVEQATGRILSAARHLKYACSEAANEGRA